MGVRGDLSLFQTGVSEGAGLPECNAVGQDFEIAISPLFPSITQVIG